MIKGSFILGSKKINLEKDINLSKVSQFNELFKKTGIKYIYRSSEKENTLTLGEKAAKKVLSNINEEVESLIFVTQSPVSTIPSSGCILHKNLKIQKECFVLDIIQGCSGFPYALSLAVNLLKTKKFRNCLIITAETYTKHISTDDRVCMPIFSDAASAVLINQKSLPKMLASYYYTDGDGAENLCLTGAKNNKKLFMHGSKVFTFTAEKVPYATNILLKRAKLKIDDIKLFIFHQASDVVLKTIQSKLKIPKEKFFVNIKNIGNTVSSTIPIALIMAEKKKIIPKNKPVLIMGFGVGYSLAGGIFKFD